MKKKYRFFYHYYRQYGCMSIHFKNTCYKVDDVICEVPCETKWSKTQPNLRMIGFATEIEIKNGKGIIR